MATASDGLGIYADDANVANARVSVTTHVNKYGNGIATVPRDEILDAVATELDVIVIPRTDLPAVEAAEHGDGSLYYVGGQLADTFSQTPEKLRHTGRRFLALAEHLEQNPPIDEAAVDALTALIRAS